MKYYEAFLYICDYISKDHKIIAKIVCEMKDNQSIKIGNFQITLNHKSLHGKKILYMISLYSDKKLKTRTLVDIGRSL